MKPMNIELQIEELVLHGFAPGDRYRIGEAVERELARLLAQLGVPNLITSAIDEAGIDAGAFDLKPNANAQQIGAEIAGAIYGGLSR